jgi:copper chaperone CopZ
MAQSTPLQFTVPDMDCESCISSITTAVKRIDADASVTADLATKHVVIGSDVEAHEIAAAIEDAGFTVQAV